MHTRYLACLLMLTPVIRQDLNSENLIRKMYDRYHNTWYRNLTFVQTTEAYQHDSLAKTTTWYEAVSFPDKFRIDFGDPKNGNAVIFRNDSVYRFQNGQLKNKGLDKNDLTFLLGGMYFYPLDRVIRALKDLHYDLAKFHTDHWKGKEVYVIGANNSADKVNQLWIDKEKWVILRLIKYEDNKKEEAIFENHIPIGGGWTETLVQFYIDDQLIQKEFYHDCKSAPELDPALFEPAQFGKTQGFKPWW
jgi:outer membrane lipoprotein-sorting protein